MLELLVLCASRQRPVNGRQTALGAREYLRAHRAGRATSATAPRAMQRWRRRAFEGEKQKVHSMLRACHEG